MIKNENQFKLTLMQITFASRKRILFFILFGALSFLKAAEWKEVINLESLEDCEKFNVSPNSTSLSLVEDPQNPQKKSLLLKRNPDSNNHAMFSIPIPNIMTGETGTLTFRLFVKNSGPDFTSRIGLLASKLSRATPYMNHEFRLHGGSNQARFAFLPVVPDNMLSELSVTNLPTKFNNNFSSMSGSSWYRLWIVSSLVLDKLSCTLSIYEEGSQQKQSFPEINLVTRLTKGGLDNLGVVLDAESEGGEMYFSDFYFSEGENLTIPSAP